MQVNARIDEIVQSEIRAMSIECDKVGGINLSQGICDLALPRLVREGAKDAIDAGINQYTRYDGIFELRKAIAVKLKKYNKINADPEKNIVVSCGATGAFYSACLALLNPGDEVIIFEPYYGYHVNTLLAVGAKPVYVRTMPPDWTFDMSSLEKLVTPRTKGIMINTPGNPSGKIFSQNELQALVQFAVARDMFIFTDEIYEYFVYDGFSHISPGSLSGIQDRVITISGYSKVFSITGWRIGYCVCHEKWAQSIGYINDLVYVCSPAPLQMGVARGIEGLSDDFYANLCVEYARKRNKICDVLHKINLTPFIPRGAYYVLADVGAVPGKTSKEKARYILNTVGVASVPGSAFYHDCAGDDLVRFVFAKKDAQLDEACRRLQKLRL
jgi:aminotransferase